MESVCFCFAVVYCNNKVVGFNLHKVTSVAVPVATRECAVTCSAISSKAKLAIARSAFFDAWDRNGLVQNMRC